MRILVTYKKSRFQLYKESPDKFTRDYMASDKNNLQNMLQNHENNLRSIETVINEIERLGLKYDLIYRAEIEKINNPDMIVSIGGDGTFMDISHYIADIPILGVNSNPEKSVGFYCSCNADEFSKIIRNYESYPRTTVNRLNLRLNNQNMTEQVLNEIMYAHVNPAAMSYWKLSADGGAYSKQRGSGILLSTATGSSGFIYEDGGELMDIDDQRIQYLIRSRRDRTNKYAERIRLYSSLREAKIWIDGEHLSYDMTLGDVLEIEKGKQLTIIGDLYKKRQEQLILNA